MSTPFEPIKPAEVIWNAGIPYVSGFQSDYLLSDNSLDAVKYVFIEGNQLIERWQSLPVNKPSHFIIAETSFGNGLNFLVTCALWKKYAPAAARLHFISCEKHPFTQFDLAKCLTLWPQLEEEIVELLAVYPVLTPGFHFLQFDNASIHLTLMFGDTLSCYRQLLVCGDYQLELKLRNSYVDAWFLNESPITKNDPWSHELLTTLGFLSNPLTTLATNSSTTDIPHALTRAGFGVSKRNPENESHRLVTQFIQSPLLRGMRQTPWHINGIKQEVKKRQALVLGAGLAGCYTAFVLAKRGWSVTLIDAHNQVGQGASGNQQAIVYPKLSAYRSPLTEFMLSAYLFAIPWYKKILSQRNDLGELAGILQLPHNQKEREAQSSLHAWLMSYPELGRLVNKEQASDLAGISLHTQGLFIPSSGWIDSPALCRYLIESSEIKWVSDTQAMGLVYENKQWHIGPYCAEILILANGYNARQFEQTHHLPMKAIRGQMTVIASNEQSARLQIPVCADGHVLPARNYQHNIGATYQSMSIDNQCYAEDDSDNLANLAKLSTQPIWSQEVVDHWTGIRAATPDYLPLVGPVANAEQFKQQFSGLASNSKRWIPSAGVYHPGLYVCAGFGSRGTTTIPLSVEWLVAQINNEPGCLPRSLVQALSPARFLRRDIIRGT